MFNCVSCFLVKKHAAFKWKDAICGFPVSPGSAEALVKLGWKIKYILIAYFLCNICAKNCRNRTVYVNIIANCKGRTFFWDTVYIFALWFLSFFFFSSPNLSGHRLDVYHTSTHGVALSANLECRSEMCCTRLAGNAGPKKLPKIRHLGTIAQLCRAISSWLRDVLTVGKSLLNSNISPSKFHRVSSLGSVTAQHSSSGRQPNFAVLNRGCHLYLAGRPSRWVLAHILVSVVKSSLQLSVAYYFYWHELCMIDSYFLLCIFLCVFKMNFCYIFDCWIVFFSTSLLVPHSTNTQRHFHFQNRWRRWVLMRKKWAL